MYVQTDILFPPRLIPKLRGAAGPEWARLVDQVAALEEGEPESLALCLMMVRLANCVECETDSYRALRGCEACALQALRRYHRNDDDLLRLYKAALQDIHAYLKEQAGE